MLVADLGTVVLGRDDRVREVEALVGDAFAEPPHIVGVALTAASEHICTEVIGREDASDVIGGSAEEPWVNSAHLAIDVRRPAKSSWVRGRA